MDNNHLSRKILENETKRNTMIEMACEKKASSSSPSNQNSTLLRPNNTVSDVMRHVQYHTGNACFDLCPEDFFEMFFEGFDESFLPSDSQWRLSKYFHVLVGDRLKRQTYEFHSDTGMVTCTRSGWDGLILTSLLEVNQRGRGKLNWYLCTDMEPLQVLDGVEFTKFNSTDQGEVFATKMLTTSTDDKTRHSGKIVCCYQMKARIWIEVVRADGDAVIGECRWYGT